MTIPEAITAIENILASMAVVKSSQVRPSGDDVDVIKVWVELAYPKLDAHAWAKTFEDDLRDLVPGASAYRVQVRAESGL